MAMKIVCPIATREVSESLATDLPIHVIASAQPVQKKGGQQWSSRVRRKRRPKGHRFPAW